MLYYFYIVQKRHSRIGMRMSEARLGQKSHGKTAPWAPRKAPLAEAHPSVPSNTSNNNSPAVCWWLRATFKQATWSRSMSRQVIPGLAQSLRWFVPFLNLKLLQELLFENEAPRTGSGDIPWHHSEPSSSSSPSRKRGPRSQETAHVSPVVVEVVRDFLSDPFAE